jgi:hypothetical protein
MFVFVSNIDWPEDKSTRDQTKHSFQVNLDFAYSIRGFQFSCYSVCVFRKTRYDKSLQKKLDEPILGGHIRIQIVMFRPIRVDHTNCLQVSIKTHSFLGCRIRLILPKVLVDPVSFHKFVCMYSILFTYVWIWQKPLRTWTTCYDLTYTHKSKNRVYILDSWSKMMSQMTQRRFQVTWRHMKLWTCVCWHVHTRKVDKQSDKRAFLGSHQNRWTVLVLSKTIHLTVLDVFETTVCVC